MWMRSQLIWPLKNLIWSIWVHNEVSSFWFQQIWAQFEKLLRENSKKRELNPKSPFHLLLISSLSQTDRLEITKNLVCVSFSTVKKEPYFYWYSVSQSTWRWFSLEYTHVNELVMPLKLLHDIQYFKWILTSVWRPFCVSPLLQWWRLSYRQLDSSRLAQLTESWHIC